MDTRHVANMNERDLMKFAQRIHKEEDLEILLQQQKKVVAKLDFNQNGGISYSDFVIATLDFAKLLTSQKLVKLFNLMDKDGDNFVSPKDLYLFTGKKLEMEQCRKILEECNEQIKGNTPNAPVTESLKLNFTNFKNIVQNQGLNKKVDDTQFINPQNTGLQMNSYLYADGTQGQKIINA